MSVEQAPQSPTLPTATGVKRQVEANEKETQVFLGALQCHFDNHTRLRSRREKMAREVASLREPRTILQALEDFLSGECPRERKRQMLCRAGKVMVVEEGVAYSHLKEWGYEQIDARTQVHNDDIKALTLLDISGDPQAEEFYLRTTFAISQLRVLQREIENLSWARGAAGVFEEVERA